jgi:hypothetical protein
LAIIGLAAISALGAVSGHLRTHEKVQRTLEAAALAEHKLSLIQLLFYEDFSSIPDTLAGGRFEEPFDRYSWVTDVEELTDTENLFQVNLEVRWDDGSYALNTMLYRKPVTLTTAAGGGGGFAPEGRQCDAAACSRVSGRSEDRHEVGRDVGVGVH